MKNLFIIAAFLFIGYAGAQEKRAIPAYTKLDVAGSFTVKLNANATQATVNSKNEEVISHVVTEVTNGTLKIYFEKSYRPKKWCEISIEVPFKALDEVSLTGSGDISSLQTLKSDNLIVALNGSGDIALDVNTKNTKLKLIGSGEIKLTGKVGDFTGDIDGSGGLRANGLISEDAKVNINGSGNADVYASSAIFARVNGSGDIRFAGNPKTEDTKVSGSGNITKI